MKVLTIKQPWATLIMQGNKKFEFRSWKTKYRGELLIHAGKGVDKDAIKRLKKYLPEEIPYGKILGKVTLTDCIKMSPEFKEQLLKENRDIYTKSSFSENYGWQMENVEVFEDPIEAKGRLSLWEYNTLDVYDFMDKNIQYGWIDIYGKEHLNTMKEFRKLYRTMSIEETLEHKIGTCIEQVNLMHYLLDKISVKNKMFCCRIFEPDDYNNLEEEEHMHCFILYYENGKVYHMEHPNFEKKGIYEYSSEEEAIKTIENYYKNLRGGKSSPTKEFFEVPVEISFKEFNKYINHI